MLPPASMQMLQQQQLAAHIINLEGTLSNIETSKQQAALFKVRLKSVYCVMHCGQ